MHMQWLRAGALPNVLYGHSGSMGIQNIEDINKEKNRPSAWRIRSPKRAISNQSIRFAIPAAADFEAGRNEESDKNEEIKFQKNES